MAAFSPTLLEPITVVTRRRQGCILDKSKLLSPIRRLLISEG